MNHIALAYQVPRTAWAAIIGKLGCESIGALTFVGKDKNEAVGESRFVPLTQTTVEELMSSPAKAAATAACDARLSLAGAQSKVAWTLPEELSAKAADVRDWLIPTGMAPSSHIVRC